MCIYARILFTIMCSHACRRSSKVRRSVHDLSCRSTGVGTEAQRLNYRHETGHIHLRCSCGGHGHSLCVHTGPVEQFLNIKIKIKRLCISVPIGHRPRHSRDERHIEGLRRAIPSPFV